VRVRLELGEWLAEIGLVLSVVGVVSELRERTGHSLIQELEL